MTIKKLYRFTILSLLIFAFLVGTLLTGCARHPSPEELNQLEQTKKAALAAEEEAEAKAQERMEWEEKLKQKQEELNQAEEDLKAVQEAVAEKK
jgi:septal ring factor EnvC (AmiA/AmiB activator)